MADEGLQRFTYALYPHERDWHDGGVREEAEDLNQPLLAAPVTGLAAGTWSALGLEGISTALGALKPAEDGEGLILRLYEPSGRRGALSVAVPEGWTVSGPLSILEEPWQRKGPEDLMPFEVRSWRLTQKDPSLA
jgi:alpha-mannosidase